MNGRRILALTAFASVLAALGDRSAPEPPPPADGPPDGYHDHLDHCAQCRDNPFGLCAVGARALEAETLRIETGPTPFHADPISHDDGMGHQCLEPGCENYALDGYLRCETCLGERAEAIRFGVPSERAIAYGNALVERLNAAESKRARKRARWAARKETT